MDILVIALLMIAFHHCHRKLSTCCGNYKCMGLIMYVLCNMYVRRISRLCFLATQSDGEPHLSLMNFTYVREEEVIVLSTRRNTKKFVQIAENPKVAVLIHDFPHTNTQNSSTVDGSGYQGKSWSITLNGTSKVR